MFHWDLKHGYSKYDLFVCECALCATMHSF